MQENESKNKQSLPSHPPRGMPRSHVKVHRHPFEVRLKAVRLYLEQGFSLGLIARELNLDKGTISSWVQRYRRDGAAGLQIGGANRAPRPMKVPTAVSEQIVALKQQQPGFGVRKISQWLRRVLFLPASAETVRRTLHENELMSAPRRKPKRNPPKPRFFERATPNQLWQSDIFTFRLGGKNAYLMGFIDDHARYLVGLDLFRSQTAEHVLEVYRTAVGEYGVPKEMLTDNGRQYASWRGTTRFEHELKKDRVHHIRSQPHHPMTLGKIERFWKTIWEEFLERAQFDSFDEARERVRWWVKFYNHKRPHQSFNRGHRSINRGQLFIQSIGVTITIGVNNRGQSTIGVMKVENGNFNNRGHNRGCNRGQLFAIGDNRGQLLKVENGN